MAALEIVVLYASSALVLALIAIFGFFIFKIGFFFFKIFSEDIIAVKRMENYQSINQKPSKDSEMLYNKIKLAKKRINSLESKIKTIEKRVIKNPEKLEARIKTMQKRIQLIGSRITKLRKRGIRDPKYAYIQLFKK